MKKNYILFLFVAILGVAVSSCSSDNNDNASIEATWEITHEGEIDLTTSKETLLPVSTEGNCGASTITFSKGGVFTDFYTEYSNSKCHNYSDTGVWTRTASKLTIKYGSEDSTETAEIVELSKSTLKIKFTETNSDGKVIGQFVAVYKRK